ncbi:hypothetical protein ACFVXC_06050 [Streptomyces sp. NPDC058257]
MHTSDLTAQIVSIVISALGMTVAWAIARHLPEPPVTDPESGDETRERPA